MCGITGIYNLNYQSVNLQTLQKFTDSLSHRGPDGSGYEILNNGSLGLGQRRLAILDLSSAGKQPKSYDGGRYWIVFNGEVFNYKDIRSELELKGYQFNSETDTEVVLASYAEWGKDCLHKFNGMWAFAIWDEREQQLFLARDRFGIKPLYYSHLKSEGKFIFASETRSFDFLDDFLKVVDDERVKEIVDDSNLHEGQGLTIFKNIYQLLPGHYLFIRKGVPDYLQTRWYDIRKRIKKSHLPYEENVKIFFNLFKDACRIRMRSDVPIASALSGGLDSSSVYSMINFIGNEDNIKEIGAPNNWKKAITALFPDTVMDEKIFAEQVAEKWGKDNWICVENNHDKLVEEIENVTRHFDIVSGTAMNSITQIYKGIKSQGVSVSLDGHGVDEMLYGYRYMLDKLFYHFVEIGDFKKANIVKETLVNLYLPEHRNDTYKKLSDFISQASNPKNLSKLYIKKAISSKKVLFKPHPLTYQLSDSPYDFSDFEYEDQILLSDFFVFSLPAFLMHFDRASMMHSVEVRNPFMDYRIVEFCFSLPFEHKLNGGFTKRILRDAMKNILPENIVSRTYKVGISSPLNEWFNNTIHNKIQDLLHNKTFTDAYSFLYNSKPCFYQKKIKYANGLDNADAIKIWHAWNLIIVNTNFRKDFLYCKKCVLDSGDTPELILDEAGICNYCRSYENEYLLNPLSINQKQEKLSLLLNTIKSSKGKYHCIIGLSGGVDSSYLSYLAKQWGLNVLIVHFDNGWNSELAVDNISKIINYTGFDLHTEVADWESFKDLQLSYIKASVLDWELPTDHIIRATLYKLAKKYKIKHILSGTNHQTEFILPKSMRYTKSDISNIIDIHQKFGSRSIKRLNLLSPFKRWLFAQQYGIKEYPLLDYVVYEKSEAKATIMDKIGWRDYGGKHYESIYTRFYQGFILPCKFGVDKRKAHLSSLINSGQITKQQALDELKLPPYPYESLEKEDLEYVAKKFDLSTNKFIQLLNKPPIPHSFYKQDENKFLNLIKKLEVYGNPRLYIKYLLKKFDLKK
jgi:asparagine synthase (glutamine-hydrolysing)